MGVEQDYSKALPILERGCTHGHAQCCHNLGVLYYQGLGVERDLDKFKLYNDRAQIFRFQKNPFEGKNKVPQPPSGPTAH